MVRVVAEVGGAVEFAARAGIETGLWAGLWVGVWVAVWAGCIRTTGQLKAWVNWASWVTTMADM